MAFTPTIDDFNNVEGAQSPQQSSASQTGGFTPTLASYNAVELQNAAPQAQQQPAANQHPIIDTLTNPLPAVGDWLKNYYQGLGHAVTGFGTGAANLIPGVNLKNPIPMPTGAGGEIGNIAGNIGTFALGGEALDAARAGVAGMAGVDAASPMALGSGGSGVSGWAANTARKALGAGAFSVADAEDNKTSQGIKGAGISAGLDLLGAGGQIAGSALQALNPTKLTNSILDFMSGGKNIEDNAKDAASDIRQAYLNNKNASGGMFNQVIDQVGNNPIYQKSNAGATLGLFSPPQGAYQEIAPNIADTFTKESQDLHSQFMNSPTFENAHNLQSQLGKDAAGLNKRNLKGNLTDSQSATLSNSIDARNALKSDMSNFLQNQNPDLANTWNNAVSSWEKNVIPYHADKSVLDIAQGTIKNPNNLASIFSSPEDSTLKVLSDLSPDTKNQIMFDRLGKASATKTPYKLLDTYDTASKQGLASTITPDLATQMETLRGTLVKGDKAITAINTGGGFLAGHGIGAIIGHAMNPRLMSSLMNYSPIAKPAGFLGSALQRIYPELATAIRANTPGGQ